MTRVRSRNIDSSSPGVYTYYGHSTPGVTVTPDNFVNRVKESMSDEVVPGFRKLARSGKPLPVNPMTQSKGSATYGCSWRFFHPQYGSNTGWGDEGRCCVPSYVYTASPFAFSEGTLTCRPNLPSITTGLIPPDWPDEAVLLQKALAKARTAGWDVGTFLAELRKTIAMIEKFGRQFILRTERILQSGVKTREEFASRWLEYRYGWRILYYDMLAAMKAIEDLKKVHEPFRRYTTYDSNSFSLQKTRAGYGPSMITSVTTKYPSYNGSYTLVTSQQDSTVTLTREIRAGVGLVDTIPLPVFGDPFNTLIEITPYALILNWFVNIKDVFAAWSPLARGELAWGFVTKREIFHARHDWTIQARYAVGSPNHVEFSHNNGAFLELDLKTVSRVPQDPSLNVSFRPNFTFANLLDLLAIIMVNYGTVKMLRGR